jgi:hypothetical protein
MPVLLLGLFGAFAGVPRVAPEWSARVGLDFWNWREQQEALRAAGVRGRELDLQSEMTHRRIAVCEQVAARVCDKHLTLAEGVDEVMVIGRASPEWFDQVRCRQRSLGRVPAGATDRDVAASYVLLKIELLRGVAEKSGDAPRAAEIAARLSDLRSGLHAQAAPAIQLASSQ